MRRTVLSRLSDEELLREVEARNILDPLVLELATRLEALLPKTDPMTTVVADFLAKRMQGKA
jgi:hypothetical protein